MIVYVIYLLSELPQFPVHNSPKKEILIGGPCSVQNGKSSATNTWLGQGRMVKAKNQTMKQILANTLGPYICSKTQLPLKAQTLVALVVFLQQKWSINGVQSMELSQRCLTACRLPEKIRHHLGPPKRNTYEIILCRILSG